MHDVLVGHVFGPYYLRWSDDEDKGGPIQTALGGWKDVPVASLLLKVAPCAFLRCSVQGTSARTRTCCPQYCTVAPPCRAYLVEKLEVGKWMFLWVVLAEGASLVLAMVMRYMGDLEGRCAAASRASCTGINRADASQGGTCTPRAARRRALVLHAAHDQPKAIQLWLIPVHEACALYGLLGMLHDV